MDRPENDSEVAEQKREIFRERAPEYLQMLFAMVFRRTRDGELTREIVQQTMVRYLSQKERENWQLEIPNERAYLVGIAQKLLWKRLATRGKAEFISLDQPLDDKLLKHLSTLFYTSDIENQIEVEERLQALPLDFIFGGLSPYQEHLWHLRKIESLSLKEIAQIVNKNVLFVRYELNKIEALIRSRVKALQTQTGSFRSDTKRESFHGPPKLKPVTVKPETSAFDYEELNELSGKEAPGLRHLVEEETVARKYVTTRYQTLIDRKYEHGLLPSENEELDALKAALDKMDEPFYDAIIKRLRRLVEKRGV